MAYTLKYTLINSDTEYQITGYEGRIEGKLEIPADYMNLPVTSIKSGAFYGCSDITEIVIPNNVTSIGYAAFEGCSSLKEMSVPFAGMIDDDSYTRPFGYIFGKRSYTDSVRVEQFNWRNGVGTSSDYYMPTSLKKVTITSGEILFGAFENCSNFTSIVIGDGVTSIGRSAFENCSSLTSLVIPDSVKTIGVVAFYGCSGLTSVVINGGSVGDKAFGACSSLTSVEIGDGVTSIGPNAFEGCTSLTSIALPDNVISIGERIFYNCSALTEVILSSSIKAIGYGAFENCSSLTSIVIPNSVTSIGELAFDSCTSLASVIIGDSVTVIAYKAFDECSSLTEIVIPASVTSIGNYAFSGCTALTKVYYKGTSSQWGNIRMGSEKYYLTGATRYYYSETPPRFNINAWHYNDQNEITIWTCFVFEDLLYTKLDEEAYAITGYTNTPEELTIPSSYTEDGLPVVSIRTGTFEGCSSLTSVVIPASITEIGARAFYNCSKLTSITVSEDNEYYKATDGDLYSKDGTQLIQCAIGKTDRATFTVPDTVTSIKDGSFAYCTSLTKVIIPNTVTSIGISTFEGCTSLASISLPFTGDTKDTPNNTHFGYIFGATSSSYNNSYVPSSLREVIITDGASIAAYAFEGCSSLKNVKLSADIEKIGSYAFYNCSSLANITIPVRLTTIDEKAFDSCGSLANIYITDLSAWCNIAGLTNFLAVSSRNKNIYLNDSLLTALTIPESITAIPDYAFAYCGGLTDLVIGNQVTSIGVSAFDTCSSLNTINLGNSVSTIKTNAFRGCTSLTSLTASSDIITGKDRVFGECLTFETINAPFNTAISVSQHSPALKTLTITSGTTIDAHAFYGHATLEKVVLPESLTMIKKEAFANCSSLTEINIPSSVVTIEPMAFFKCLNLAKVDFAFTEAGLTTIDKKTFYGCKNLTEILLPDSITKIADFAFYGCTQLAAIKFSSNVKNIEESAFEGCNSLAKVYYKGDADEWQEVKSQDISYVTSKNKIDHFDLVLYPFKTTYGLNNKTEYKNSFKYTAENLEKIKADLAINKTIAHNLVIPTVGTDDKELACIKNYLKLKARITTTKKVTLIEETEILNNIYKAIYTNFNARQIEFGEEIPYDALFAVIKNADYRIREVNLDEPDLATAFCLTDGTELAADSKESNEIYNKLARRNILAGKISAFKYDEDFISEYDKTSYPNYSTVYPEAADTKKIVSVKSHFNVATAFANKTKRGQKANSSGLVLKENEVIQFRCPNFKTTKTYPAYVNYYIKLNTNALGDVGAVPATFQTLKTYLAQDNNWVEFVQSEDNAARLKSLDSFTDQAAFETARTTHVALFKKQETGGTVTYQLATQWENSTPYWYFPLNEGNNDYFVRLNKWITTQSGNHGKPLEGIYRTSGVQELPYGELIDIDQKKYWPAYKFGTARPNKDIVNDFYIQITYKADNANVLSGAATEDGLGRTAVYSGAPKDGEYQLQPGEYLLVNYTESKTVDGTESKSVVNYEYPAGTIIRANFNLIDSERYNINHSWSKRNQFYFENHPSIKGMFTLGANEQIEIRELVTVELKDESMYLYWTLNSDDSEKETNEFKFIENYNGGSKNAYTLQDGEHLYYTDSKKQDLVYYGAGTLIVRHDPNLKLIKYTSNGEVSEEEIMTNGLAAAIPWQVYNLKKTGGLTIIENQYISLTEGDTLVTIDGNDSQASESYALGNDWNEVNSPATTKYRFAEDTSDRYLPQLAVDKIKWSVRSRLDFNMSKTTAQPLYAGNQLMLTLQNTKNKTTTSQILEPDVSTGTPMYINSNYTCQAAVDTIDLSNIETDLKLKVSSKNAPMVSTEEYLTLDNYINGDAKYTQFAFANLASTHTGAAFSLNISIPTSSGANTVKPFGLVAMYYIKGINENEGTGAYLRAVNASDGNAVKGLSVFNTGKAPNSTLHLVEGLNIIKISSETERLEVYADNAKKSTVIFGGLDVVMGINPKLDYKLVTASNNFDQLLSDLRGLNLDTPFYYNVPIQRSNEIDLNAAVEDDLLSSPLTWYDPNNVNRKFVISEVDAEYLPTGITLTKLSRL